MSDIERLPRGCAISIAALLLIPAAVIIGVIVAYLVDVTRR